MDEATLRETLCELGRRLYARGLVAATDGNLSARLEPGRYLCTPSGVSKGYLRPDSLVIADANGVKRDAGPGKVSSEFFTHLAAYECRPDAYAVVHAHPPAAVALALAGHSLETPVLPELWMGLGPVPTAPYATPGTREGAEVLRVPIRRCDAVLLDRHGAVTIGPTPEAAWMKMEQLEHGARILLHALSLRPELPRLDQNALDRLQSARDAYLGE